MNPSQANKKEIFSDLYNRYQAALFFFAQGLLQNYQDAEDIVTESFIKFWNGGETFQTVEAAGAWLRTTTRNACYDLLRLQKRRRMEELDVEQGRDDTQEQEYADMQAELLAEIYEAVQALPQKSRKVFELKYIDGLKNEEICERLGTTNQTVRNQLASVLKTLRLRLQDKSHFLPVLLFVIKTSNLNQ